MDNREFLEEEKTEEILTSEDIAEEAVDNAGEPVAEVKEEDAQFHPDVTSSEDRKKIMEGYKKSLRNRVFAPLVGGGASINPIEIINEESREEEDFSLDFYDVVDQRLTAMEKKAERAVLMAEISTIIAILAAALAVIATTLK